ncbi:hypothetical protein [Spirulina sp. CS-785/01]|uniref:hypothetical protein n=1 Tax=Spirulina sp. CS-785/01 TaxID=3021716 RepID=UPI00232B05EB|nr:hypothetical protein [Spirulina sp. CS-785/01]
MANWTERSIDRYYVQPPIHSYSLASWLSCFGSSPESILLFQCCCYIIFCVFTALILRKYGFSKVAILCIPVVYTTSMSIVGLRQDALAMAYLAIGLWFLTLNRGWKYFFGFCFLGVAWLSAPISIAYIIPFTLGIIWVNYSQEKEKQFIKYFRKVIISWFAAFISVFSLFLWTINFEFFHFWDDFTWHASLRVVPPEKILPLWFFILSHGYNEIIYGSIYLLYLTCLFMLLFKLRKIPTHLKYFFLLTSVGLVLNLFLYPSSLRYYVNFFVALISVITVVEIPLQKLNKSLLAFLTIVVFCVYQIPAIVSLLAADIFPTHQDYTEIKSYVSKHPNQTYLIDNVAARFVFDYNLPKNAIAWHFSQNTAIFYPHSLEQKDPNTVWIIAAAKGAVTQGLPDYPKAELWGRKFNSIPQKPYEIIMIK